jgi:YHS domain-containing protein
MKTKMILIAALAVILGGGAARFAPHILSAQTNMPSTNRKILYYTCPMHPLVKSDKPGGCPICGMSLIPVYGNEVATTNAPSSATNNGAAKDAKPYPFDTCLVDGMKLGSMGDPYVFVYHGQEIKFCCSGCKPIFLKDPDKYLKKIRDAVERIPTKMI